MKKLAQRMSLIKPSPTLAITAKAAKMRREGIDVIGFGAGEPDFDTPENIKQAAIQALKRGETKYTPSDGTPELKKAIIDKLARDNNLNYKPSEIIVSCGAKHSLYNIAQVLFEPGDEVIIPAPYWVSYPDQVLLNQAKPVIVQTDDKSGFKISPQQLREAFTPQTKAVIINSPSNPTGVAYTKDELKAIGQACVEQNVYIISDEIYEKITFDGFEPFSIASLSEEIKNLTLVVNGVSKAYAMTGWRMGFCAGPEKIIQAMNILQGQVTSNITSITQAACVEAYNGTQEFLPQMVAAFKQRRDFIVSALNAIEGIRCINPQGAFYVFPNISGVLGKKTPKGTTLKTDDDFCEYLLTDHLVAAVAGTGFGAPGYMRLSYATSMENIEKGVDRITKAVRALQ